ncbi:hypothetical protein TNIN_415111 [Trichonephila inaurata madagascariensis]|uniref:Uncharacterized protein n=1 Tax=Trichonephila inaurata madagascariensis TaxID=2747483 RepID=A0A8X6IGJ8_9ARAC|nr:hypothetical protein TNIN_415111 [Trichonephila inaurata madagascariensis]
MGLVICFRAQYAVPNPDILIFKGNMKNLRKYSFNLQGPSQFGIEIPFSLNEMFVTKVNTAIPQVLSPTVYVIYQALDLKAELVSVQDSDHQLI